MSYEELQSCHVDVVKITLIVAHVLYLTLQSHNDGGGEIDAFEALGAAEPAGAEHVDFHQLVAHDIQAHEEHAVGDQLGPHDFHNPHGPLIHFRLGLPTAGVDVTADV